MACGCFEQNFSSLKGLFLMPIAHLSLRCIVRDVTLCTNFMSINFFIKQDHFYLNKCRALVIFKIIAGINQITLLYNYIEFVHFSSLKNDAIKVTVELLAMGNLFHFTHACVRLG